MYTLKLTNGDLDFTSRRGTVIRGREKLKQQLGLWVSESYGIDRFHPRYGCRLQDFIGSNRSNQFMTSAENELRRVINLYISQQAEQFDKAPQNFDKSEVIIQVLLISSYFKLESLYCAVSVKTMANVVETFEYEVD